MLVKKHPKLNSTTKATALKNCAQVFLGRSDIGRACKVREFEKTGGVGEALSMVTVITACVYDPIAQCRMRIRSDCSSSLWGSKFAGGVDRGEYGGRGRRAPSSERAISTHPQRSPRALLGLGSPGVDRALKPELILTLCPSPKCHQTTHPLRNPPVFNSCTRYLCVWYSKQRRRAATAFPENHSRPFVTFWLEGLQLGKHESYWQFAIPFSPLKAPMAIPLNRLLE